VVMRAYAQRPERFDYILTPASYSCQMLTLPKHRVPAACPSG
jgi:hypothetical protein